MTHHDRVYGDVEIIEPVILELLNCASMQRLKGVDQAGYMEPYFPGSSHSRFEHSVGVYLLLRKYGASLEEQIAGLIHDVSHSAFSHTIDYVLAVGSEKEQNHQDNAFSDFVKKLEIPEILKKYQIDLDYILDDHNFPLKENNLPDICADRIDYSLRGALAYGEIESADYFLDNLIVQDKQWIFKDFTSAKKYAELFNSINAKYYAGLPSAMMFRTSGDCLRHAILQGYISEADLYTTDAVVLGKIKSHLTEDAQLKLLFARMSGETNIKNDPNNYDVRIFCKSRMVDPLCLTNEGIKRVSEVDSSWIKVIQEESRPKEYFLKFES